MIERVESPRTITIPNISQTKLELAKKKAKDTLRIDFAGYDLNEPGLVRKITEGLFKDGGHHTIEEYIDAASSEKMVFAIMDSVARKVLERLDVIRIGYAESTWDILGIFDEAYEYYSSPKTGEKVHLSDVSYENAIEDIQTFLKEARELNEQIKDSY